MTCVKSWISTCTFFCCELFKNRISWKKACERCEKSQQNLHYDYFLHRWSRPTQSDQIMHETYVNRVWLCMCADCLVSTLYGFKEMSYPVVRTLLHDKLVLTRVLKSCLFLKLQSRLFSRWCRITSKKNFRQSARLSTALCFLTLYKTIRAAQFTSREGSNHSKNLLSHWTVADILFLIL